VRLRILLITVAAVIAFGFGIYWLDDSRGFYNVDFSISRSQARDQAREFLTGERGADLSGLQSAISFDENFEAQAYLERTLGQKPTGTLAENGLPVWKYTTRFFQPQQKEEYRVSYAPNGDLVKLEHRIPQKREFPSVSEEQARAQAEAFVAQYTPYAVTDANWNRITSETDDTPPNRTDYTFVWERSNYTITEGISLAEGSERIRVTTREGEVGAYSYFMHVPQAWTVQFEKLRGQNQVAQIVASTVALFGFLIPAVVVFGRGYVQHTLSPRWPLILGAITMGVVLLNQINQFPIAVFSYPTTQPFGVFVALMLVLALVIALLQSGVVILAGMAGDIQQRISYPQLPSVRNAFARIDRDVVRNALWAGSVLFMFHVFFVNAYYKFGTEYAGFWSPGVIGNEDLLGTYVPVIFAVMIGVTAALSEELLMRMFGISFLKRFVKYSAVAVVLTAVVWAFLHSTYPSMPWYVRGVELTILGSVYGLVYLRYGILAPIVGHAMVNTFLGSVILWVAGATTNALIGFGIVAVPVVLLLVGVMMQKTPSRNEAS